jgi:hypothetical protein
MFAMDFLGVLLVLIGITAFILALMSVRVANQYERSVEAGTGSLIELEIWALPAAGFGEFVAAIPPPLSIGTVRLADGRGVKGFIVEPTAITGARYISAFGGWRAFMAEAAAV